MATEILRPDAAGAECNLNQEVGPACPNHYQNVDEASPDEGTTQVGAINVSYLRDLYNIANSTGSGTINFIKVYARCIATASPSWPSLKIAIKSNSTVTEDDERTLTTGWVTYSKQWDVNPADGGAWEWADIDALQIGLALRNVTAVGDGSNCTQVYVEVDYIGFLEYEESASVIVGVVSSASRATAITKTASTIIGTLITSGTDWAGTVTVYIGVKSTASRVAGFVRQSATTIGNLVSASRQTAISRASSVIAGVVASASRIRSFTKTAAIVIGIVATSSRATAYIRTASVKVGILATAWYVSEWIRLTLKAGRSLALSLQKRIFSLTLPKGKTVSLSLQNRTLSLTLRKGRTLNLTLPWRK